MSSSASTLIPAVESRPIKVAIVDDSLVARALMGRVLENCGSPIQIVATATNGSDAIAMAAAHRLDVIVLDLEMPKLGGLKALPQIIEASSGARVLVVSSLAEDSAAASIEALFLGATDTLAKPRGGWGHDFRRFSDLLVEKVRTLGECTAKPQSERRRPAARPVEPVPAAALPSGRLTAIAIAASTGGPAVLFDLLRRLPSRYSGPVFVTQHLPAAFIPHFAMHLERHCTRRVVVAADGQRPEASTIYLAPGEAHLELARRGDDNIISLSDKSVSSGCRPSADPMFESFGQVYGKAGAAIVLSGMGKDGLEGVASLRRNGGRVIVQDQATSVVWGMPGAIAAARLADAILSPDEMVEWLQVACASRGAK